MMADDLAITSVTQYDMQASLNIAQRDSCRDRYKFNVDKTKTITINCKQPPNLTLNGEPLGTSNMEPHLGIVRNSSGTNTDTINARITSARNAIFSLLGAGLRGYNGQALR